MNNCSTIKKSNKYALLAILLFLSFAFNQVKAQSLTIEQAFTSGCYFNSGTSKTTISVQVGWTGASSGDLITVQLDGSSTRLIHPQSMYDPGIGSSVAGPMVTPQVVAFEINADGANHTVSAVLSGSHNATASSVVVSAPSPCIPLACSGNSLGGMVYFDNNANGSREAGEIKGIAGVLVTVFDVTGNTYTTTSDASGLYAFTSIPVANYPVRVEFSNWPASVQGYSGASLNGNKSSVRFVSTPTCTLDCGGVNPLNYSQSNPPVFSNLYTNNDPLAGGSAGTTKCLIVHDYNDNSDQSETTVANSSEIGSVWSKTWNKYHKKLFIGAFLKRHVGLGPIGIGGIYALDYSNPASPSISNFLDVTTIGINVGQSSVPSNFDRGLDASKSNPNADASVFGLVGKAGIGNMDLSDDGNTLYFMNLYDNKVYAIDITAYLTSGTTPTAANVTSYSVPDPGCTNGTYHAFALKVYSGKLYVGLVCDGSTGTKSNMVAFVKALDLTTYSWSNIFDFPLTYPKGFPDQGGASNTGWNPWNDDMSVVRNGSGSGAILYPVPIFSDIEFDLDGTMVLAFMDRTCHQMGVNNYDNGNGTISGAAFAGGDVLRAFYSNGAYVLENNAKAGPNTGWAPNNNQGPGFGEFYNDNIEGGVHYHTEMVTGGLTLLPGSGEVMVGMVDPSYYKGGPLWANGVRRLSNIDGSKKGAMAYYSDAGIASFGKANGMGDMELATDNISYIEIGNYVWNDKNHDGIQTPGEDGIPGLIMGLYNSTTGALVATHTTDANGNYYFSTLNGDNILPNTAYCVLAGVGQYNSADSTFTINGTKYRITLSLTGEGANPTLNDNNFDHNTLSSALGAMLAGLPSYCLTTGAVGYVNHTIDLGLKQLPSLGDTAWYDANRNGIQDGGEAPVTNHSVTLKDCAGSVISTTTTDSHGFYKFSNLEPGVSYKVTFAPLSGYTPTTQDVGSNDSTDSDIDPVTLTSQCVSLHYDEFNPTIDAGFVNGGTLGNYVWFDANANCLQDDAASNGINGVKVYLYKDNGSSYVLFDSTVTANDAGSNPGYYNFIITSSGNYKVKFPTSIGTNILSCQNPAAGTDGNSDADQSTGYSPAIVMNLGGSGVAVNNPTIDAGYKCVTNAGADQFICAGNSVVLTGLNPTNGTWSALGTNPIGSTLSATNAGVATASYTSTSNGEYSYIYTSGFCTDTMKVKVVLPMADIQLVSGGVAIYSNMGKVCVGNTATLSDANAGGTWTSSNTAVATIANNGVVTAISTGYTLITYKVDSTSVCGCNLKNYYIYVDASPALSPITGSNTVCVGSVVTLMNSAGGGIWTSSNSNATVNSSGNVTGVTSGSVVITYTATNGCGTDSKTISLTVCQPIAPILGTTNLCTGSTSQLTNATAGGTWSSGYNTVATVSNTGLVTAVSAGWAAITYTAPIGTSCCSNSSTVYVYVTDPITLAPITGSTSVCTGQYITLSNASGGGTWSSSDNNVATINSGGNVYGVAAGTAIMTYSATNTCGTVSRTATITVGGLPLTNNTGNNNVCVGSTNTLSNTTAGGTWSSSDNNIATVDNAGVVTGVSAGYVYINYTVTAGSVCGSNVASTYMYVNATPTLAAILGGGVVCVGSYITLTNPSGGGIWSSSDNAIATVNSSGNVQGITPGTATITYTAHYWCNNVIHTLTQDATVYVQASLASITGNTNICLGNTSTLANTTAGGTWSSSNNAVATVDNNGVITSVSVGSAVISYTVGVGSVCGNNVATTNVLVTSAPVIAAITGNTTICAGSSSDLSCASSNGHWSSSNHSVATIDNNGHVHAISNGTSTISYAANTTCGNGSNSTTVTVLALPATPTISGSPVVCNGTPTILTSSAASGNQWYKNGVAIVGANGHTLSVSSVGTYSVETNNGSCTSLRSTDLDVTSGVIHGFSININPQELGGNNFIFTAATPTTHNNYVWDFGDGYTSTAINPSRSYVAADTYAVKQIVTNTSNGCIDSSTQVAIVTSCCVTSGSTGGTESKSLGNVISQRFFGRVSNSISEKVNYAQINRVVSLPGVKVMGFGGNVTLQSLLPGENSVSNVLGGTVDVYPTSPTDLEAFTNALEVQAQDYTKNANCKAVAFATKTSNMIYGHTKPVCDRLREAELQDIQNVTIGNVKFVQYKLRQNNGIVEYAISFSAGKNASSNFYEIQSKWLNDDYSGLDTMYNFQIWGVNPQVVKSMVNDVLNNLNNSLPYYQLTYTPIPATYIMSHRRNQMAMDITINNNTAATSTNLYFTDNMNELSTTTLPVRTVPVTINPFGKTTVTVDMADKYQTNVKLADINNNITQDAIYSNDGPWDINYNPATTAIQQFNVVNDGIVPANNEWRLFRNVSVKATTSDFVSVFKMMKAAALPRDINAYNSLKFTANASGATALKITFVKNSITDWNSQYSVTIPAKQGTQDYTINYADLVSAGLGAIDAKDITAITISFLVNIGTPTTLNATISNAKLVKSTVIVVPTTDTKLGIYPNPVVNGSFTCSFNATKAETLVLNVVESGTGKILHTEVINSVAGNNKVSIKMSKSIVSTNNCVVTLQGDYTKYDLQKIVISKQ